MKAVTRVIFCSSVLASLMFTESAGAQAQACTPAHHFQTVKPGVLTIAVAAYPPFDRIDPNGTFSGVDADILQAFADKECLKIEATSTDPAAAIQYVTSGRADISSSAWYRTSERAKVVGISDPLYLDTVGIFSRQGFKSFNELQGKTVGTVQGYNWVSDLQSVFGGNLKLYPNPVALIQDLKAGRVDVGVNGYVQGTIAEKKGELGDLKVENAQPDPRIRSSVQPAQSGFLYTKENAALGGALNAFIKEQQSKGDIARILGKHGIDSSVAQVGEPRYTQ
jgi:polar amino acid transport system substrate-binding protein